jgi:hypothetical protein
MFVNFMGQCKVIYWGRLWLCCQIFGKAVRTCKGKNAPAYFANGQRLPVNEEKSFITLTPGACTIELFTAIIVAVS